MRAAEWNLECGEFQMKAISLKGPDRSWIIALILIAAIGFVVSWVAPSSVDIGATTLTPASAK
jgi:hypothetical protein